MALRGTCLQRLVQVDEHHHAGFRGHARQRNEPDDHCHADVVPKRPHQPDPADQRERDGQHYDQRFGHAAEVEVEQQEDQGEGDRDDDAHLFRCTLHVLVLPAPGDEVAGREFHMLGHGFLGRLDITSQVAFPGVQIDVGGKHRVFGADAGGAGPRLNVRQFPQRHLGTRWRVHEDLRADPVRIVAQLAWIAHHGVEPLPPLDHGGHHFAPQGSGNHILQLSLGDAVLR